MPVPSSISDLTKVAATNSPQGTESVKGTIDDYLRAHASFIRQLFDQLLGPTVSLSSAAKVDIGFAGSINVAITGNTTITSFDTAAEGTMRWVTFGGSLTLTHNATSLQLPGAASIQTAAGDIAVFKSLGSGNWKCAAYQRASGTGPHAATTSRDGFLSAADWATFNGKQAALGFTPYNSTNPAGYLPASTAAATYLPLGGGVLTGPTILANGVGLYAKDSGGNTRALTSLAGDNNVYCYVAGGNFIRWYNQAGTAEIANLSNTGAFTAASVTETSDVRKKKLFRRRPADFLARVAAIKKLGDFVWRKDGTPGIGTSAQELEAIWPEAVQTGTDGVKSVRYGAAAFVIAVELARAFLAYVAKTDKRLAKLEAK